MNIVNNRDTATEGNLTIRYTRVVCFCLSLVCCAGASTGTTYDAGLAPPPDVLPKPDIFVRDAKPDDLSLPRARVEYGSIWKEEGETYKVLFNKPGQIARFTNRLTGQKTKLVQFDHRPDYFITAPGTDAMWVYKRCPRPGVYRSQRTGSEYLILTSEKLRDLKAERRRQDYRHALNNSTGVSVRTLSRVDQRVSGNTDGITLTGILMTLSTNPDDLTAYNVLCLYIEENPHDLSYEWLLGLKYLGEKLSENETRARQTIDLLSRHNAASPVLRHVSASALSVRCPSCSGKGRNARGVVCVKCRGRGIAESRSKVVIAAKEMARQIISMYFAEYEPLGVTSIEQGGSLLKTSWVTQVTTGIARSPQDASLYNQLAMLTAASLVCSNTDWLIAIQSLVDRHNGHRASADAGFQRLSNLFPNSVLLSDTAPTQFYSECSRCSGKGKSEASCTMCAGSGVCNECRGKKVVTVAAGLKGCFMCKGSGKCVACNGTGKLTRTCKECEGSGRVFHKSVVQAQLNSLATRITRVDLSDVELEYATRRGWGLYAGRWMPINMVSNAVMRDAGYALHQGRWIKRDDLIAQGLVEHEGQWMTPVEMTNRIMAAKNATTVASRPDTQQGVSTRASMDVSEAGRIPTMQSRTSNAPIPSLFKQLHEELARPPHCNEGILRSPYGLIEGEILRDGFRELKWGDSLDDVRRKTGNSGRTANSHNANKQDYAAVVYRYEDGDRDVACTITAGLGLVSVEFFYPAKGYMTEDILAALKSSYGDPLPSNIWRDKYFDYAKEEWVNWLGSNTYVLFLDRVVAVSDDEVLHTRLVRICSRTWLNMQWLDLLRKHFFNMCGNYGRSLPHYSWGVDYNAALQTNKMYGYNHGEYIILPRKVGYIMPPRGLRCLGSVGVSSDDDQTLYIFDNRNKLAAYMTQRKTLPETPRSFAAINELFFEASKSLIFSDPALSRQLLKPLEFEKFTDRLAKQLFFAGGQNIRLAMVHQVLVPATLVTHALLQSSGWLYSKKTEETDQLSIYVKPFQRLEIIYRHRQFLIDIDLDEGVEIKKYADYVSEERFKRSLEF